MNSHLGVMSRGPTIGRMWVKEPDNATLLARHCHGIVSYDAPGDDRQPGSRAGRLRLRRYPPGTPRGVAATGAGREEGCQAEPLGARVRLRVRPIVPGSSPVIRRMSPHRHLPMPM